MDDQSRIRDLLQQILTSNCTPDEACREYPDLLPIVRERLKQVRSVEARVAAVFPARDELRGVARGFLGSTGGSPPTIPGYEMHEVVGSGGMGVVYKARHLRLNRIVAIKMLLAGGYAGARELARFKREAEAVAALQHPNIVQVHDAGEHDGFPYFTMEFTEGGSLAQKLAGTPQPVHKAAESLATLARAVHAAHESGIVHRDLKPGNVLLTGDGTLKIADFGLARRLDGNDGTALTHASAHAGTPSYMSPEQARGTSGADQPPVDVYALGAILYEMITGRPPFRAGTAVETQRQVIEEEPAPPTRLNTKVPRDLETICLKCLQKDPARRYATAADLAADLERFLKHEPIQARRSGWLEICARWVRRRPAAAGLIVAVVLLVAIGTAGVWWIDQQRRAVQLRQAQTDQEVRDVLQRARSPLEQGWQAAALDQLTDALGEGTRAVDIARRGGASAAVQQEAEAFRAEADSRVSRAKKNRALLEALLDVSAPQENSGSAREEASRMLVLAQPNVDEQCLAAFRQWGLDVDGMAEADVVERLRQEPDVVVHELIAALDAWMLERRQQKRPEEEWRRLFRVADQLDRSDEQRQLRALLVTDSPRAEAAERLREIRQRIDPRTEPVLSVALLAQACDAAGDASAAEQVLRQAVASRPDQVVLLNALGKLLERQPSRIEEAIGYYRTVRGQRPSLGIALSKALARAGRVTQGEEVLQELALQHPENPATHYYLGVNLWSQRRYAEAEDAYRQALDLDPDHAGAYTGLGVALSEQREFGEAESAYRKAIELRPDLAEARTNLAIVLQTQGKLGEAEAACREAIERKPGFAAAHNCLGNVLFKQRRFDEAEAAYRKAIELEPDLASAHVNLGSVLHRQGKHLEAEAAFRQAIELEPDSAEAHLDLGYSLLTQGKLGEAEAAFRKVIELEPDLAKGHNNLGKVLDEQQRGGEAEAAFRRAIELEPDLATAHHNLGNMLFKQGKLVEAEAAFRRAIELAPDLAEAHHNLGNALHARQRDGEAEAAFRKAIELKPDLAAAHDSLGIVLQGQGKHIEAEAAFRRAIELQPAFASAYYNLGAALIAQADFQEATAALKKSAALFPEGDPRRGLAQQRLQQYQRFAMLDERLPAILRGTEKPASAAEQIEFARLCLFSRNLTASAARLYADALASEPRLAEERGTRHRYDAACSAALAGCGRGDDRSELNDAERARWRARAREWLRAELDLWKATPTGNAEARELALRMLTHWRVDSDLAGLRDPDSLATLPQAERDECLAIWSDVDALLERLQAP